MVNTLPPEYCTLLVYDIAQYNFLRCVADVVHGSDPRHLIFFLQLL